VLHVALMPSADVLKVLPAAFGKISTHYEQIDWIACARTPGMLTRRLLEESKRLQPTLVWMQMQNRSELTGDVIAQIRRLCQPGVVICQWDGDLHWEPRSPNRQWFVDLGKHLDASLTAETKYQKEYADLGVVRPGFLTAGADLRQFGPREVTGDGYAGIVFLASRHPSMQGYVTRYKIVDAMERTFPSSFVVHGHGWGSRPCARPLVALGLEAQVYSNARAAISISIRNDVDRYTSDRLFRMLCSGALCLVERFPDCEGLGLDDGVNCLLWSTWEELQCLVTDILATPKSPRWELLRRGAAELGRECHTWDTRMLELLAIVDAIRGARGTR
jgi:hypothetical protein